MKRKVIEYCGRYYTLYEDGTLENQYGRKLKPRVEKDKYPRYELRVNKNKKRFLIHRLLAESFIDNPMKLEQVNHIDGDKSNYNINNLEWVSASENQKHSRYVLNHQTGFSDTPVKCVETGEEFISTREVWRKTKINYCHISECTSGKRKTAGGFHWQKVGEYN